MAETHHFLAIDFGAESGRGILVNLREGKAEMEEIHRWPNTPVRLGGTLYWDFPFLYSQMLASMRICADRGVKLSGISPDTWGVDFGLLDGDGKLLSLPVHYRDSRTDGIHEYSDPIMTRQEIYAATGYEHYVNTGYGNAASSGRPETGDHFHGSGLAGPVGAQKPEDLAFVNGKADIVKHGSGTEFFA